jgi:hypothetical protein
MRRGSCSLIVVIAAVLCTTGSAATEILESEEPLLIGRPYPALAGIDELYVSIAYTEPNTHGLLWKDLRQEIQQKLVEAGIKMYAGDIRSWPVSKTPVLIVEVNLLSLPDRQTCVFSVRLALSRPVYTERQGDWFCWADVWKKGARMMAVPTAQIPKTVTASVLEELDTFILAHRAANPAGPGTSKDQPATVTRTAPVKTDVARPAEATGYVASKNSKVFHRTDCSSAKRIAAKNLVAYNTRQQALNAGKRPCKLCKP